MAQITVDTKKQTKELGDLFGIFFEDINHAADGGLYGELVRNRSFEFDKIDRKDYNSLTAWKLIGEEEGRAEIRVEQENPLNLNNTHYVVIENKMAGWMAGIRNIGFNSGIFVEEGKNYRFSIFAKRVSEKADENQRVSVTIEDQNGNVLSAGCFEIKSNTWEKYELTLSCDRTTKEGRLTVTVDEEGKFAFDMVSLFPVETFMRRENGMREDLGNLLKEMKPKFMRFPGGCLVHGGSIHDTDRDSMYRWKKTIGPVEERPSWRNNWGYNQTLGLGYYEYFCLCEDLNTKPLPVLPGGFNPHQVSAVPMEEMQEWVDEALDLIEFANGGIDTKWGKIRADLGHKEPFHLEYIGIGNEEIGDEFYERYPLFHKAIREKYPDIKIINTAGPFASGEGYETGWASARKYGSDLIDEHYYQAPEWFLANMHHYDDYDANGTKVFLGEYASWGNLYYNALVEAAYMTHLEKAPAVALACYAPMLCNADYVNWQPDMIWFDNHRAYGTANYYVQKLFMNHQGDHLLDVKEEGLDQTIELMDDTTLAGTIAVSGNDIEGRMWDITVTNLNTNEVSAFEEIHFLEDNKEQIITDVPFHHYQIDMKFKRSKGRKGFKFYFGKKNSKNFMLWEFGGWDNFDSIISAFTNGCGSCISHRIFHVEEREYTLKLVVDGRKISAFINGECFNETVAGIPHIEELYVSASREEESQDIIVKAVNVTGDTKEVCIHFLGLDDTEREADIYELAGYPLDAMNSFEEPEKVKPVMHRMAVSEYTNYVFPKHSVTVIRILHKTSNK